MAPVLEQPRGAYQAALSTSSSGYGPSRPNRRQVVAAGEHVDRVDLKQADLLQHAPQGAPVRPGRAAVGEALRRQRDPARLGSREPLPAPPRSAIGWFLARQAHDPQPDRPPRRAVADLVGGASAPGGSGPACRPRARTAMPLPPARRDRLIVRARDQAVQRRPRLARALQGAPCGRPALRARSTASVTVAASESRKRTWSSAAARARGAGAPMRARAPAGTPSTCASRAQAGQRPAGCRRRRACPRRPRARRAGSLTRTRTVLSPSPENLGIAVGVVPEPGLEGAVAVEVPLVDEPQALGVARARGVERHLLAGRDHPRRDRSAAVGGRFGHDGDPERVVEQRCRSRRALRLVALVDLDDAAVVVGPDVVVAHQESPAGVNADPLGRAQDVLVVVGGDLRLRAVRADAHQPVAAGRAALVGDHDAAVACRGRGRAGATGDRALEIGAWLPSTGSTRMTLPVAIRQSIGSAPPSARLTTTSVPSRVDGDPEREVEQPRRG